MRIGERSPRPLAHHVPSGAPVRREGDGALGPLARLDRARVGDDGGGERYRGREGHQAENISQRITEKVAGHRVRTPPGAPRRSALAAGSRHLFGAFAAPR
jgi:hypothetical protein